MNGPLPETMLATALPSAPPKQETFCTTEAVMTGAPVLEMVATCVEVHPFASVAVTV